MNLVAKTDTFRRILLCLEPQRVKVSFPSQISNKRLVCYTIQMADPLPYCTPLTVYCLIANSGSEGPIAFESADVGCMHTGCTMQFMFFQAHPAITGLTTVTTT